MDQVWQRIIDGASFAELLLTVGLAVVWASYRKLVNDLRADAKKRRAQDDD